jgi:hypothetical protein
MVRRDARLLVERTDTLTTAAAVIVGPSAADDAEEADQVAAAVGVVGSGAVTAGAGYTGPLVAIFF